MGFQKFPDGFVWGAATAAYQIEGAWDEEGKAPSIWDDFSHTPGKIRNGDTGDVACDHYHRYPEDIALMKELGLQAYRFSISWPRVMPEGIGKVNEAGVDFYSRLVDGLLEAGIEPTPTLYHWDLPSALERRGGWPNPDCAAWFANYAELMFSRLGDRVKRWITLNEPVVVAGGYIGTEMAPGRGALGDGLLAGHSLLVGHGLAVQRLRALHPENEIGITLDFWPSYPATDSAEDTAAAHRMTEALGWFPDPIFLGDYPAVMRDAYGDALPQFGQAEIEAVTQPLDFLGLNNYSRHVVKYDPEAGPHQAAILPPQGPVTAMNWEIYPHSLRDVLLWMNERAHPEAIYVTENGAAFEDHVDADGRLRDEGRRQYVRDYLSGVHEAIARGVPVRGYFVWSLLDNFEWAQGYAMRFGIVRVDYDTMARLPKESARWYSETIRANGFDPGK
jgi:beta-glucosidase